MRPPRPTSLLLLGHPVAHSLSPRMQTAALRAAQIDATYEAVDVTPDALDATITQLRARNAAGNVTIPHKQAIAERCDRLTEAAAAAAAVNTFWMDGDQLIGDNTDIAGFDAAARALLGASHAQPPARRIALIGAGGAASAVAIATRSWSGAALVVWTRRSEAARAFTQRFEHARAATTPHDALADADLVVNATPVGLHDSVLPFPIEALASHAAVLDLVYRPDETAIIHAARAAGHRASDGIAMLVEQGAIAFTRWFGIDPDRSVMWRALGRRPPQPTGAI